jgi:hypothetical protein
MRRKRLAEEAARFIAPADGNGVSTSRNEYVADQTRDPGEGPDINT